MSKKTRSGIIVITAMLSVLAYFIWGMIAHSYENAWLVYIVAGIVIVGVSIFGGKKEEGTDNPGDIPQETDRDDSAGEDE